MHVSALSLEATGLHSIITIITICSPRESGERIGHLDAPRQQEIYSISLGCPLRSAELFSCG